MKSDCDKGFYFDEVVGRCQGCHEICYGHYLTDVNSDCNRFCAGYQPPGPDPGPNIPSSFSAREIAFIIAGCCMFVILLTAAILVFLKKYKRGQQEQVPGEDPDSVTATQPTEEQALSDLHIGTYPRGHYLTAEV